MYALPLRIDSVFDPALWETADSRDPQRIAAYLDVCKTLYIPTVDIAVNVTGRGSVKVAIARPRLIEALPGAPRPSLSRGPGPAAAPATGGPPATEDLRDIRNDLMSVDLLPREAQGQVAAGDELAVAPPVEGELVLVAVVGVAVEFHDDPSLDHQIHLADALDVHPVLEAQTRGLEIHARQCLQGRARPIARALESGERPGRAGAAQQCADLLGRDLLVVKGGVKGDERGVVLDVAAQEARQGLGKRLHRKRGGRRSGLISVGVEDLAPQGCELPAVRNDEVDLLASSCHRQAVVAHSGLTGEQSAVDTGQDEGAAAARDADDAVLVGGELSCFDEGGDMASLSAGQFEVADAHGAVAAADEGEKIVVHEPIAAHREEDGNAPA